MRSCRVLGPTPKVIVVFPSGPKALLHEERRAFFWKSIDCDRSSLRTRNALLLNTEPIFSAHDIDVTRFASTTVRSVAHSGIGTTRQTKNATASRRIDPVLCRQILVTIFVNGYDATVIAQHITSLWETFSKLNRADTKPLVAPPQPLVIKMEGYPEPSYWVTYGPFVTSLVTLVVLYFTLKHKQTTPTKNIERADRDRKETWRREAYSQIARVRSAPTFS